MYCRSAISEYWERQARSILKRSIDEQGLLVADSPKGAVPLGFPIMGRTMVAAIVGRSIEKDFSNMSQQI